MIPVIWSMALILVHLLGVSISLFSLSPYEIPSGEYISPLRTMELDTLINCDTILRYAPDWDGERLGVDVRYLSGSTHTSQSTILAGSYLLVFSDSDSLPLVCHLEGQPAYFSISRSGLFALVYHRINTSDTARYVTRIDLRTGSIDEFKVVEGANFLQQYPCHVLISDEGKISVPNFLNASNQAYYFDEHIWKEIEPGSDYVIEPFSSQAGSRMLLMSGRWNSGRGYILSSNHDTLTRFDPGRSFMEAILTNSGNTVLYSSTIGISAYYMESGEITGDLFEYSGIQAPVVSASDSYWSCTFRHVDNSITGDCIVITGKVRDVSDYNFVYSSEAFIRTLAVSDQGDVLCTQALTDPRLHQAYRYLIVDYSGRVIWASEFMSPFFFNPRPSCNSFISNVEIRPRLADISGDGDRLLLWDNGLIMECRFDKVIFN